MNLKCVLHFGARVIRDGFVITATTSAAMAAASMIERGTPWAAFNPVCHMIDGDDKAYGDGFDTRDTLLGAAASSSAMFAWAGIYQFFCGRVPWPNSMISGTAASAAAYVIDYHLVPKRFTPGIEQKLSARAIFAIYAVMALTFAALADSPKHTAKS
jgi:hypothetical protein